MPKDTTVAEVDACFRRIAKILEDWARALAKEKEECPASAAARKATGGKEPRLWNSADK